MFIGRPFTYPIFGFISQNQWRTFTRYRGKPQIGPDQMAGGARFTQTNAGKDRLPRPQGPAYRPQGLRAPASSPPQTRAAGQGPARQRSHSRGYVPCSQERRPTDVGPDLAG